METQFLHPRLAGFATGLPRLEHVALVMAPVGDFRHELLSGEDTHIGRMAEVRLHGFSSGRHCAHLAQQLLGLAPQAVLRDKRVPVWPSHSVGSITHSDEIAAAVASTAHSGVGVDIEQTGRVDEKLYRVLFTDKEKGWLRGFDFDAATVMFSAKEAGYKAIYPTGQAFIGFQEAEIHLDPDTRTFRIDYLGEHAPNAALNSGTGHWQEWDDHVLTLFTIP